MLNEHHDTAIRQGPPSWNDFVRRSRLAGASWAADLTGADLARADLTGADLARANLAGANLQGANLRGALLEGANLGGAGLQGADLVGANLAGADLRGAFLEGADLHRANLAGANLVGGHLRGAILEGADLGSAVLERADLRSTDLTGADLAGAFLRRTNLRKAVLSAANLEGADLTGARLSAANLEGAHLTDATLTNAFLRRATLTGADLTRADLTGADLIYVVPNPADLTGADLTGALLSRLIGSIPTPDDQVDLPGWAAVQVNLSVPLAPEEPAEVLVDLMGAIGVLTDLAVAVGPRLGSDEPSAAHERGTTTTLARAETNGPIRIRSLRYGSPFTTELVESMVVAVPLGTLGVVTVKDLLKGPDKSGLLALLFTLFVPAERREFFRGRVLQRQERNEVLEASKAEAESRRIKAERERLAYTTKPTTTDEMAARVNADVKDDVAAQAITEKIPDLRPLTARAVKLEVSVNFTQNEPDGNTPE